MQSGRAVWSLPRQQAEQAETSLSAVFEDFIAQDEMHPNETGRAEARDVAVGRNQKKCSRCQPQQLRRAITNLPQSEESFLSPWKKDVLSSTPYTPAGFLRQQTSDPPFLSSR